jgi:chemotaxis signal transduction protein
VNNEDCLATIRPTSDQEVPESRQPRQVPSEGFQQVVVLAIGDYTIGVPKAALVDEVLLSILLPHTLGPAWLLGMALVDNDWVPVISVENWLRGGTTAPSSTAKIALLDFDTGYRLGLLIDTVIGYRDVFQTEIVEQTQPEPSSHTIPVRAITQDNLLLIDVAQIFAHPVLTPEGIRNSYLSG